MFLIQRNAKLPLGFPSEQVFEAYLNPRVDDSKEAFSWANPDLHGLRLYPFVQKKMKHRNMFRI